MAKKPKCKADEPKEPQFTTLPLPKKPEIRKFGEMAWGTKFQERGGERIFIKMMDILPSGLRQRHCRVIKNKDGSETNPCDNFNAFDIKGYPATCPDWLEYEVLEWVENPIGRPCLEMRAETANAVIMYVDPKETLQKGDYCEIQLEAADKIYHLIGENLVGKKADNATKNFYVRMIPRDTPRKCEGMKRSFMTLGPGMNVCGEPATMLIYGKTEKEKEQPPMALCAGCYEVFHKRNPDYKATPIAEVGGKR